MIGRLLSRAETAVERMSTRERVLLLLTLLAVTYALAEALFLGPAGRRETRLARAVNETRQELVRLEHAETLLARTAALHPNARLRTRLARLRAARRQTDRELRRRTSGLVPARRMGRLLERLLGAEPGLSLTALASSPARPLLGPSPPAAGAGAASGSAPAVREAIYVHTFALRFRGRYGATLAYLRALEHLPWRFYWDRLSLRMRHYPVARARLVVHTLGLRRVLFAAP